MIRYIESSSDQTDTSSCASTSTEFDSISLVEIDIAEYLNGNETVQKSITNTVDYALHKYGSFRIKNHGISADLINQLFSDAKDFFDADDEIKSHYMTSGQLGANGWEKIGQVNVAVTYNSSSLPDPVESMMFWFVQLLTADPNEMYKYCPPNLCELVMTYHRNARKIISILQNIFTSALDLPKNQFQIDMTDVNNTDININFFNEFRLWNYWDLESEKFKKVSDEYSAEYRFGEHSDFSCITLLRPGNVKGTQIKLERFDNKWYTISEGVSEDSIIVNLGEVFEMYTSGYWIAPKHRVARLSMRRRQSIVDFFGPNMDREIDELKGCVKCKQYRNETIMAKYELPITYREHARMRFGGSFAHEGVLPIWL